MYYPNMMNAQQPYQTFQNPYAMNMTPQTPTTLTRVTGIDGAKAYQMTPNSTVALFDNNEDIMYIKTTDGAGFPTIRTFSFNEVTHNTQQQLAECCCTTQRAIDGVNYNGAINTAAINANTTAQTQKVLDAIQQNKIESLQSQVNQLQLQSAMCGVVRYPNSSTYSAGYGPFYNNTCCNNGMNI